MAAQLAGPLPTAPCLQHGGHWSNKEGTRLQKAGRETGGEMPATVFLTFFPVKRRDQLQTVTVRITFDQSNDRSLWKHKVGRL